MLNITFASGMLRTGLLHRFLVWRLRHIPHRRFVLFLSFIIGMLGGLAAILLKNTVHYTSILLTRWLSVEEANLLFLVYPLIGIILTVVFVNRVVRDRISHGVSRILHAISRKNSYLAPHHTYSSMVASTLTVGFGGSVGLEAPIVLTGASIGSNLGRMLHMNYKTTTLLVGCGAAGAIAGIFKAPIAAVVFALEVLMLDLTMASLIPLLISAVTGATLANFLLGKEVIFYFTLKDPFVLASIPYYIILGVVCGLLSWYYTWGTIKVESFLSTILQPWKKLLLGGLVLGFLIFLFPPLYGEGYDTLRAILGGDATAVVNSSLFYRFREHYWLFLLFLFMVIMFKMVAMSVTTGSGGVGGIFAPTLFSGGILGFLVARIINGSGLVHVSESNFALVGMAGLMAGIMHAPLTAIFLIAEITGGYGLFIPLIIASTIAYLTVLYFEPHSIYTHRLARRGELLTHYKDQAVLTLMKMDEIIEKDLRTVKPEATLGELVRVISRSRRNIFPVVDDDGSLKGIVLMDQIRDTIFNPDMYNILFVRDLMITPPEIISVTDSMESVMQKFNDSGAWNLPVAQDDKYMGMVSKSKMFSVYRKWLMEIS